MQLLLISGILGLAFASFSSATQVRRSYVAASVMHFPHNSSSTPPPPQDRLASTAWARSVIQTNLQAYTEYVRTASVMHRADIIVFPESGTGYLMFDDSNIPPFCENIPVPGWTMNCSNIETSSDSPHAEWASCAAQRFNIDIVVNYCGIDPVTSQRFNLNAAFLSGSGLAIASYRKSHINAVPVLTQPSVPDPVVFVSSFGVEFGLFVCYDLWFRNPVHDDLTKLKARHFAYPNGMASLTPLFTIDQVHAGFSLKHNVTLVSAGLFSTGGAGVFHRGDALVINPQWPWAAAGRSVVTARVPLTNEAQSVNPPTSSVLSPVTSITGVSCFASTASCAVFAPGVNASFALKSSFIGRHGRVDCEANVTTLTGNSTHVWMLAASQLTMVPAAPNTPNASLGAYCMLLHCDTPDQGCNFGDPSSLSSWESDLELTSAAVRATFSSGFYAPSANGTVAYPVYGQLAEGVNQTSQIAPWPLTFLRRGELHYREDLTTNTYQLQTTDAKSTGSGYLLSFGIYAAAAGPQW